MRRLPPSILAAGIILTVLATLWPRAPVTPLTSYDQPFYLGIAYDLETSGRFTDGFVYAGGGAATARPPGMRFTPLYPAFLRAAASLDPSLRAGMACVVRTTPGASLCPRAAPFARGAQFLMLAGFYGLLWAAIGRAVSPRAAWTGLAVGLLTAPTLLRFVNTMMTETLSLLLGGAACALAASACQPGARRPLALCFAAGLALGLWVLTRPVSACLLWVVLPVGGLIAWRQRSRRPGWAAGAITAGALLVVLPWITRNLLVLHRAALSFGYASHTLIQRIAFDAMTPREFALSFVCWLPGGAGLGKRLAGAQACDRFGWSEHADSFYAIGNDALMRQSLAASGGWEHHLGYIVRHDLLAHPLRHLLVTVPLAWRGMFVGHFWGLLLAPVSLWVCARAVRERAGALLMLSLPAWFLLLVNAALAVNQPRYNLLLVLPFSLAAAVLLESWLNRGPRQRGPATSAAARPPSAAP